MAASPPERDPNETQEWLDALDDVLRERGPQAAHALLEDLITRARGKGAFIPFSPNTPYVNTIPTALEAQSPGDHAVEWRIRSLTRWNATAMVVNDQNKVETRVFQTERTIGDQWLVTEGLEPGERVIVEGVLKITADAEVKAIERAADAAPATASTAAAEHTK